MPGFTCKECTHTDLLTIRTKGVCTGGCHLNILPNLKAQTHFIPQPGMKSGQRLVLAVQRQMGSPLWDCQDHLSCGLATEMTVSAHPELAFLAGQTLSVPIPCGTTKSAVANR